MAGTKEQRSTTGSWCSASLYAGGKYDNNAGDNYGTPLGLSSLGSCATQYASEFFDMIHQDGFGIHSTLKRENLGGLKKVPL